MPLLSVSILIFKGTVFLSDLHSGRMASTASYSFGPITANAKFFIPYMNASLSGRGKDA